MSKLSNELKKIIKPKLFVDTKQYKDFLARVRQDGLTKVENPESHFCVFFIPFNPETKQLFIVDHKKAKQWIVTGGHIEKGETLEKAIKREAQEELGLTVRHIPQPFMLSIIEVHNEGQKCRFHHDIWYLIPTDETLNVNFREFNNVQWTTIVQAKRVITHPMYLEAVRRIEFEKDTV